MSQRQDLENLVGQDTLQQVEKRIPSPFDQTIYLLHTEHLLNMDERYIANFYEELFNDNRPFSIVNIAGSIIILSTHLDSLLQKLVEVSEVDQVSNIVKKMDMHYRILFCAIKYQLPEHEFIQLMKFKHYRNMLAHDFNGTMETGFQQAIEPLSDGQVLVQSLIGKIKSNNL